MKVLDGHYSSWDAGEPHALTIGVFDGLHLGHQSVIRHLQQRADGRPTAVLTFDGHPLALSAPDHAPLLITNLDQKLELLESFGIDLVGLLTFDMRIRVMSPRDFVGEVIVKALQASYVVVGSDFRFGFERAGDVTALAAIGQEQGFEVEGFDLVGTPVPFSSTAVRSLLHAGDVSGAAGLLGRRFQLRGIVVPGDGRGRQIGIPTANLSVPPSQVLPKQGVYSAYALVDEKRFGAVVNIGVRPTFGGTKEVVEAHLLGFDRDLYAHGLSLVFVERIRGERKFESVEDLIAQIRLDIGIADTMLIEV